MRETWMLTKSDWRRRSGEVGVLDAELCFGAGLRRARVINDAHAEAAGAPRHRLADGAEADQPEGRAVHLLAEQEVGAPGRPLAGADDAVAFDDAAAGG